MGKQYIVHVSEAMEQTERNNGQQYLVNIDNTAIAEYLEIIKTEYEIERNKKQSFENRVGYIMALIGTMCIFLLEKISLKEIFSLVIVPLTLVNLVKIVSGLAVYGGFLFTMLMLINTISVKPYANFEVKNIDETLLVEQRLAAFCRLIITYKDIIIQHREINEKKAIIFRKSLYGISVTLISVIIYIAFV